MSDQECRSCYRCRWLAKDSEGWEMPHHWWYECHKIPARANLKSFPFRQTVCGGFELAPRQKYFPGGRHALVLAWLREEK